MYSARYIAYREDGDHRRSGDYCLKGDNRSALRFCLGISKETGKNTKKVYLDIPERGMDLQWEENTIRAAPLNEAIRFSQ